MFHCHRVSIPMEYRYVEGASVTMFETLAVATMFGLLFATLIILLLIPLMNLLLFRVKFR
jgi:multidrug efflux pump subunit AcrB